MGDPLEDLAEGFAEEVFWVLALFVFFVLGEDDALEDRELALFFAGLEADLLLLGPLFDEAEELLEVCFLGGMNSVKRQMSLAKWRTDEKTFYQKSHLGKHLSFPLRVNHAVRDQRIPSPKTD